MAAKAVVPLAQQQFATIINSEGIKPIDPAKWVYTTYTAPTSSSSSSDRETDLEGSASLLTPSATANLQKLAGRRVQLLQRRPSASGEESKSNWIAHLVGWPTFLLIPSDNLVSASGASFDIRTVVDADVVSVVMIPSESNPSQTLMGSHKNKVTMQGAFATDEIKALTIIFDEKPLARTEKEATDLTGPDWQVFASQYNAHREEEDDESQEKSKAEELATAKHLSNKDKKRIVLEIFSTNAYQAPGSAVLAARLNHSCANNCSYFWNEQKGTFNIFALRDIAKGEELLVSYVPSTWPRTDRQQFLAQHKRFVCTCEFCGPFIDNEATAAEKKAYEAAKKQIEERDKRLKRIDIMYKLLPSLVSDPVKAATMVESIIKLIDEDSSVELKEKRAAVCYDMFQIEIQQDGASNNKSYLDRARKWAERALTYSLTSEPNLDQRALYERYAADPTQYLIAKAKKAKN